MPLPRLRRVLIMMKACWKEFSLHSVSGRAVGVVFASRKITGTVEFELLFKWQRVELAAQSKLIVDFLLADVEVLHIEETYWVAISDFIQ
jgi:hypothetical protein